MTRLSVIIVNYNVKYFLEQALHAVRKACHNLDTEVIVVDNNSVDGSAAMVRQKFPEVTLIANTENLGFSKANNQAIQRSAGEYILLLNPDTVVEEDTFEKTVRFMDDHPDAGALGVKMLDGKGNFLPESKRAFPSPDVAFYKIFGLSALFPKSKTFGKYHLGHLPEDQVHPVDVLAGAFMLIRKSVLDKIGLLDESFFMYGEDIDLSYRIIQAGYVNYYFPETRIIHYKGESTKKGSLNYVRLFYQAMIIFAKKHFPPERARLFALIIKGAIYFKAGLSIISRFFDRSWEVILDAATLFGGIYLLKDFWEEYVKDLPGLQYPAELLFINVPLYIFIWLVSVYFSGGYDKPFRTVKMVRGLLMGSLIIAAVYGFLEEEYRFSRAIILLGSAWAILSMVGIRVVFHVFRHRNLQFESVEDKKIVIVGSENEGNRVLSMLNQFGTPLNFIGFVVPEKDKISSDQHLGYLEQLAEITAIYRIKEIIFCGKDISSQQIIRWITRIGPAIDYKIVPEESLSIIGSNSKDTAGDLYAIDINMAITSPTGKRNKRVLDIVVAVLLVLSLPVSIFVVRKPGGLLGNILAVLAGRKSWVGYHTTDDPATEQPGRLPGIRPGILTPVDQLKAHDALTRRRLNLLYAKDYSIWQDIHLIRRSFRQLGG